MADPSLNHRTRRAPQFKYNRAENYEARAYYPGDMNLTYAQRFMCAGAGAAGASIAARPLYNLSNFSFIWTLPTYLSHHEKQARFFYAITHTNWLKYPWGWTEHWAAYFLPCAINSVVHENVERALGRGEKKPYTIRSLDRHYKEKYKYGNVPVFHNDRDWRWWVDGYISGGVTGAIYTVLRQPLDVLRHAVTDPNAPKRFTGAMDVLMTMIKHKPENLLQLYHGYPVSACANGSRFGVMFGLYHQWKWEMGHYHPVGFLIVAWLSAFVAEVAHFPFHTLRVHVLRANKLRRFSAASTIDVLNEIRKKQGITILYDGFFGRKPMLMALGFAVNLTMFDLLMRNLWDGVKTNKDVFAGTFLQQQQKKETSSTAVA